MGGRTRLPHGGVIPMSKHRSFVVRIVFTVLLVMSLGAVTACAPDDPLEPIPVDPTPTPTPEPDPDDGPEPELPASIETSAESIRDQDDEVLLHIDELPDEVSPDGETSFGGPTRFTNAVLSDDGRWIAIGTVGTSHGYAFLYDVVAEEHHVVAFQFGGEIGPYSWSPDDRFALFVVHSPAPTETLKIVDRDDIGEYAEDTGFRVEVDREQELEPPFSYEPTEWRDPHTLCFELDGTEYCVDAATRELQ